MADEDDQWLYGDSNDPEASKNDNEDETEASEPREEPAEPEGEAQLSLGIDPQDNELSQEHLEGPLEGEGDEPPGEENNEELEEGEQQNGDGSDKEDSDDDSDDDVNVVIGDIKTSPSYAPLNIKRGGLLTSTSGGEKLKQQPGKFSIDEFESAGVINGIPAQDYNLDNLEDKPWRKPGADITDYFNYGFNEDTWRAYCERQKRLRVNESGVGLAPMNAIGMPRSATAITNDNSKYSGNLAGPRKAGPPPGRRMMGSIDVIGGNSGLASRRGSEAPLKVTPPKENVIQVMTADRREYSRKPGFPDMSVPPPGSFENFQPEFGFNPEPEPYYGGYEPTQDIQWGQDASWTPSEIKELTPGPITPVPVLPPPVTTPIPSQSGTPPLKEESPGRNGREASVERPRSVKSRDRERERSHRRDRSRSRSRRHKSRSRSPSHRSHRKKKSRRHDDSD